MPRNYRQSKRRPRGDGDSDDYHQLNGSCFPCMLRQVDHDGDALRPEWEKRRDVLLPQFIKEHPGERPWAWWAFDAPGRRELAHGDGRPHPFDDKQRTLHVAKSDNPGLWKAAYGLFWGYPAAIIPPFDDGLKAEMYESTWEYLVRCNLLLPEDSIH